MDHDLAAMVRDKGIKYLLFSFTDLFGVMRSKLVPAHAVEEMQDEGAGFAGFAAHLDMTPADPDLWAVPDPASLIQLPWQPELGWVATNLVMNDAPVGSCAARGAHASDRVRPSPRIPVEIGRGE